MTDKPYTDQINREISGLGRLWRKRPVVTILVVVFLIGYFGYGIYEKIVVLKELAASRNEMQKLSVTTEREIADLKTEKRNLQEDLRLTRSENAGLRETVAPLLKQAATQFPGEEINSSLKKVIAQLETFSPTEQPLRTATATISVVVASKEKTSASYMDRGGYLALVFGATALLETAATTSSAEPGADGEVIFRGVFQADQSKIPDGLRISSLMKVEYAQISFLMIPEDSIIRSGHAAIVLNNVTRIEFDIPRQLMDGQRIFVREIKPALEKALGNHSAL